MIVMEMGEGDVKIQERKNMRVISAATMALEFLYLLAHTSAVGRKSTLSLFFPLSFSGSKLASFEKK